MTVSFQQLKNLFYTFNRDPVSVYNIIQDKELYSLCNDVLFKKNVVLQFAIYEEL